MLIINEISLVRVTDYLLPSMRARQFPNFPNDDVEETGATIAVEVRPSALSDPLKKKARRAPDNFLVSLYVERIDRFERSGGKIGRKRGNAPAGKINEMELLTNSTSHY